jgi:hypothetical protein
MGDSEQRFPKTEQQRGPFVRISGGHGRHGKAWEVELVGGSGYGLVNWKCDSFEGALESATREFPGLPYTVKA